MTYHILSLPVGLSVIVVNEVADFVIADTQRDKFGFATGKSGLS